MRTLGVGKKVTPKDTQNSKIIKKGCNSFLITVLNIRPWRNWITQQIPILEIGGSNPFGRAKKSRSSERDFFIQADRLGISSRVSVYIINSLKRVVSHHTFRCVSKTIGLMIYKTKVLMICNTSH